MTTDEQRAAMTGTWPPTPRERYPMTPTLMDAIRDQATAQALTGRAGSEKAKQTLALIAMIEDRAAVIAAAVDYCLAWDHMWPLEDLDAARERLMAAVAEMQAAEREES